MLRRSAMSTIATLLAGAAVLTAPAAPAYAVTCTPSSHCYGQVEWHTSQIYGINQGLDVRCLGPMGAPTSSNFVTEEEWEYTAGSSGGYWVELGMAYGAPQGSTRYFFWADNRPNGGGYHEHDLSISTTFGHTYDDYITWVGNNSWQVRRDGSTLGTSTANPGPSYGGNAGEELTANTGAAAAITQFLFKQTSSGGGWSNNWPGAYVWTQNPPYGGWITSPYSADFYSNCSFLAAPPPDPGPTFAPFTAKSATSAVKAVALELASVNGVAAPTSIQMVLTSRQTAAGMMSQSTVDSNQDVYLVTMSGDFVGNTAKVPSGAEKPRGGTLTMTIDPATGRIVDWGIEVKALNLTGLGAVQHLN